RWWATRTWRTPGPRKPNPPIWSGAGKGAWSRKVEQRVADEGMVDDILAKVREGGISTLSEREKATLLSATERLRSQEAESGRVDRL
ncbi:MAG: hypothetical protein GY842_23195, partial [bacterium]|nr:hypothetical protein [bacterium]